MSSHLGAAVLNFPGGDARVDLTDPFVFESPQRAGRTILILDVNPFTTCADFDPDVVYRINVDTDGDTQAYTAFPTRVLRVERDAQTSTVYYATGSQARRPEPTGELLMTGTPAGFEATATPVDAGGCGLVVGLRSDPFFPDGEGAFHDFEFTGAATFAGQSIVSMALEVPNDMRGPGPEVGLWATASERRNDRPEQIDRIGNPSLNPFFIDELKNQFNAGHPADHVAEFLEPRSKLLENRGYPPAEARDTVLTMLPDILHEAQYRNGRVVTDDVYDMRVAFLTRGKVTSDGVDPHDDYLTEFPYLGLANAQPSGEDGNRRCVAHIRSIAAGSSR
jgi:Domain of unknown function (DUF4331)